MTAVRHARSFDVHCTVTVSHTFERRLATVTRASWLERAWTRLTGDLDCLSLLDVSFTDSRRTP